MTRYRTPILMGAMMGLMLPWMMHVQGGGLLFVLAHIAVIAALAGLALISPRLRRRVHRPNLRHIRWMLPAVALGWGATCLYCRVIDGTHWS